jgi:hypothetical protein
MPTSDQNTRSRQCQSTLFYLSRHWCPFIFWTVLLNISGEKYSLALRLVEINTDPDRQALDADLVSAKLCQSVRVRINTMVKTSLRLFEFFLKSCFNLRVRISPVVPVLNYDSQVIRHAE